MIYYNRPHSLFLFFGIVFGHNPELIVPPHNIMPLYIGNQLELQSYVPKQSPVLRGQFFLRLS